ncbi:ABZJ_00895 family protein [Tateyamaria armeniaca]|uniref:ABZJ_00895 family protein n=1 Tax=Tateyamaria armeniaca TaxID=2518930 RepID=A0ABW8UWQ3_9RHOB
MTDAQILKRYTVVTLITFVALILISLALDVLAGVDAGAGMGIASIIVPAMDAGGTYVRKTGTLLDKPRMWRLAPIFTMINFGLGLLILMGFSALSGFNIGVVLAQVGFVGMLLILVGVMGLYLLVGRFFLGMGARSEMKRQERTRR